MLIASVSLNSKLSSSHGLCQLFLALWFPRPLFLIEIVYQKELFTFRIGYLKMHAFALPGTADVFLHKFQTSASFVHKQFCNSFLHLYINLKGIYLGQIDLQQTCIWNIVHSIYVKGLVKGNKLFINSSCYKTIGAS